VIVCTAGMITKTEIKLLDQVITPHGKWWVPFVWSCNLVRAARRQGRISDNYLMKTLLDVRTVFAFIIIYCFLGSGIFGFLVFILVVVGLFCQYHSQVIGWKDSSPK